MRSKAGTMEVLSRLPQWPGAVNKRKLAMTTGYRIGKITSLIRSLRNEGYIVREKHEQVFPSRKELVYSLHPISWDAAQREVKQYKQDRRHA